MGIVDFYDELAPDYHLIYQDWNAAVEHQGVALDRLIRSRLPDARSVLDCSCGIGTQALGLAGHGYKVHGTDVSEGALDRARVEAIRRGLDIAFTAWDIRDLERFSGTYDVVISCDNALPHLLTDLDIAQAFRAICAKLRPGGLVVITVRDYDKMLVERPVTAPTRINPGPPRKLVVRLQDWDAPDSPMYTVHFLILTEGPVDWTVTHHSARYRAIGREALTLAAANAGFTNIQWHEAEDIGFFQPAMTALRGADQGPRPSA
jgi:glycine/sarcosine N-methyltransferase